MKGKQKWMGIGMATLVGVSALTPVGQPMAQVHAQAKLPFNKDVVKAYQVTEPLVKKAEETKKAGDVKIAYESFVKMSNLFILDDQNVYKEGNDMDKLYERLKKLMYGLPKDVQKTHLPLMADKWVETVRNNQSSIMYFYLDDFLYTNKNKDVQKSFDLSKRKLNFYQTMPPGSKLPKGWDKDIDKISNEQEKSNSKPVLGNPNNPPKATTPKPSGGGAKQPTVEKGVEYIQEGDTWFEIVVTYKGGNVVKTDKRKLTPQEAPHLYQVVTATGTNTSKNPQSLFPELTAKEKAYLLEDQNAESKHTIQYSLDKQGEAPYYFDTGLRVDAKMNASYEQYKDVLYQIAVKSDGHVVEDMGRVLVVIDKKAVIVEDIKKSYSETEIESLFESFPNIDIRILETRIGTSASLEQQIVSKQARTVSIAGKKVELESTPIVKEGRVLLPIRSLTEELGATLVQKGDQFTVTKGKDSVVYELKSTKVVVKGKEVDINIAPDVKDNVLYVEMSELAKAFNYEMIWDGDSSELSFNVKEKAKADKKDEKKPETEAKAKTVSTKK